MAVIKAQNPLLASKQHEVAQRVLAAGFGRDDFKFITLQAREHITALRSRDGASRFDFYPGEQWVVNYSPAEHTAESGEIGVGDWANVLTRVDWWLSYVKRESNVTDPWAVFTELSTPFSIGGDDEDNTPFTDDERQTITRQLEDIETFLLNEGAKSEEDRHAIIDGINRANDELANKGRIDWRTFTLGILFELMLFGYATPEGVRHTVNLLLGTAQHLLR